MEKQHKNQHPAMLPCFSSMKKKIHADYKDGVLSISLPKKELVKTQTDQNRRIASIMD